MVEAIANAHTSGKLGFGNLPDDAKAVKAVTDFARAHQYPNLLLLGIGGSALGPAALDAGMNRPGSGKRLVVLDNIDPDFIRDSLDAISAQDTIVNVIAKSGVTAETMATFAVVRKWMIDAVGETKARDRFVITTDPVKGDLLAIAKQEKYPTFEIPPNIGGRFSVLTAVGTLPAALIGIDIRALLAGAGKMAARCAEKDLSRNPAGVYALLQWLGDTKLGKVIHVQMPYSDQLRDFPDWLVQLWAESLGKHRAPNDSGFGPTPLAALGATDQHSQVQLFMEGPPDKTVTFITVGEITSDVSIPSLLSAARGVFPWR